MRKTESHKANFARLDTFTAWRSADAPGRYRLIALRCNDQCNTTICGNSDRLRGIEGTRRPLRMNPDDIARAGLTDGQVDASFRILAMASTGRSMGWR